MPRALIVALPALLAVGCLSPPVHLATSRQPLKLHRFPEGTQLVELRADDGTILRGVFVDAGPGAPVVATFPESGGTITRGSRAAGVSLLHTGVTGSGGSADPPPDFAPQGVPLEREPELQPTWYGGLDRLRALGVSVLAVDPTGIGASDGERDAGNIRRDALLVWYEALRRAGGDASRVLLRGMSVGALCFRQPVRADLLEQLMGVGVPLLVVVPRADVFLVPAEQRLLRDAVQRAGGAFLVRHDDHVELTLAGRQLLSAERWFLVRERVVPDPRVRLDDELARWQAGLAGALTVRIGTRDVPADALDPGQPARARLEWLLADLPPREPGTAAGLALACLFALDDPARRLVPSSFESTWIEPGLDAEARLDSVFAAFHQPAGLPRSGQVSFSIHSDGLVEFDDLTPDATAAVAGNVRRGIAAADARRLVARSLLSSALIPSRIPVAMDSGGALEVCVDRRWSVVPVSRFGSLADTGASETAPQAAGAAGTASGEAVGP